MVSADHGFNDGAGQDGDGQVCRVHDVHALGEACAHTGLGRSPEVQDIRPTHTRILDRIRAQEFIHVKQVRIPRGAPAQHVVARTADELIDAGTADQDVVAGLSRKDRLPGEPGSVQSIGARTSR